MHFQLTVQQQGVQAAASRLAGPLRSQAIARDDAAEFPLDALKAIADAGLMGVNVSPELGGLGAGVVAYSHAVTTIAAADPAVAVTLAVNNMVSEVLEHFGSPEQKSTLIPAMTSGAFSSGSFCLSEPGSGSDAAAMKTRARRTDQGWILSGTKAWITSGAHAGVFLVWARTGDGKGDISLFSVDPGAPGVSIGSTEEKMGQHASNTVALAFDDVSLADDALVGDLGAGFPIAMMALDGGRIGIASQSLGIADAARAIAHEFDLFDDELRELDARLEAARSITWRAAFLKEKAQSPFSRPASIAKLMASELACLWPAALLRRLPTSFDPVLAERRRFAQKLLCDARVTRIYEGTSEIQRVVIARDLLRRSTP